MVRSIVCERLSRSIDLNNAVSLTVNGRAKVSEVMNLKSCICTSWKPILLATMIFIQYELGRFIVYKSGLKVPYIQTKEQGNINCSQSPSRKYCSLNPDAGPIKVKQGYYYLHEIEYALSSSSISNGGRWRPLCCMPRSRVAVLVPYRNRPRELANLLLNLHPFLQRQMLDYTIFLVEQSSLHAFNKGATVNAGFLEIVSRQSYDCFIIHDVDVIPEDDRIWYECNDNPRHLSAAIDIWNYKLIYTLLFGGALTVTRQQFESVNGFSNAYFGWGGEDDDFGFRIRKKYKVVRYPMEIARYKNLVHKREEKNPDRIHYYNNWDKRNTKDGVNSIHAGSKVLFVKEKQLFTHIMVEFNKTQILQYVEDILTLGKPSTT